MGSDPIYCSFARNRKWGLTPFISCPDGIALRLPRVAVEELEEPLAPREHRIVRLEQAHRRHDARPLERTEKDVVGEARTVAGDERVLHEHRPHRIERAAERRERLPRIAGELLERLPEALLARLAEVRLVLVVDLREEIEHDHAEERGVQAFQRPLIEEIGER